MGSTAGQQVRTDQGTPVLVSRRRLYRQYDEALTPPSQLNFFHLTSAWK